MLFGACGSNGADSAAFCNHLDSSQDDLVFHVEMTPAEILATTRRAQEIYTEAARLAPDRLVPLVDAGIGSWQRLEFRFTEAFEAGLDPVAAFDLIQSEWESLVDIPANERVVAFVAAECGG